MNAATPKNLTAFAAQNVKGNPPSATPSSSVENCFPGLEIDARNLFSNVFVGITVDAFFQRVLSVENADLQSRVPPGTSITSINGEPNSAPFGGGWDVLLANHYGVDPADSALGAEVTLGFSNGQSFDTRFNRLVVDGYPVHAKPGQLSQSLCSPWQHDFVECGCYYWAATRPDVVTNEDGVPGQNWVRRYDHHDQPDTYRNQGPEHNGQSIDPEIDYQTIYHQWEWLAFVRKQLQTVDGAQRLEATEDARGQPPGPEA